MANWKQNGNPWNDIILNSGPRSQKSLGKKAMEPPTSYVLAQYVYWLVVSTHLKNISQNGNLPQIGVKIKIFETTTQYIYITIKTPCHLISLTPTNSTPFLSPGHIAVHQFVNGSHIAAFTGGWSHKQELIWSFFVSLSQNAVVR